MSEKDEDTEKPYEASSRKLVEERKKGNIARSADAIAFVAMLSGFVGIYVYFTGSSEDFVQSSMTLWVNEVIIPAGQRPSNILQYAAYWIKPFLLSVFLTPLVLALASLIATRQLIFTGKNLEFKISRISLLANAKKKYGKQGIVEFLKSATKFFVLAGLAYVCWTNHKTIIMFLAQGDLRSATFLSFDILVACVTVFLFCIMVFAFLDILWQRHHFATKNRMSHKEMKDEHKNEEGDETIRQQRRAKAEEIATNRMLLDVPKASVVITNPTHYAIALRWDGDEASIPICVAKGTDETARRIREIAVQSRVPLFRDPPTARKIHATVNIGMPIEHEHYRAVAIAIAFAKRMERKVRAGGAERD